VARAFKARTEKGINIRAITAPEIKLSMLRSLHGACGSKAAHWMGWTGREARALRLGEQSVAIFEPPATLSGLDATK
jgi:hypothetical protein